MNPLLRLLVVPLALDASVALAATSTDEAADPDLVPQVEPSRAPPVPESGDAARRGTDAALGPAHAHETLVEPSAAEESEDKEPPSEQNEDASHEDTRSAPVLPAESVLASQAGPARASKTTPAAKPEATVRTTDGDHFTVLIVAPSGAQTDILLDASGRILGVRNVERPAPSE